MMVDGVFEDLAGFEEPLALWWHGGVPVDKLDGVWEFAEVGIGIIIIRARGSPLAMESAGKESIRNEALKSSMNFKSGEAGNRAPIITIIVGGEGDGKTKLTTGSSFSASTSFSASIPPPPCATSPSMPTSPFSVVCRPFLARFVYRDWPFPKRL